MDAPSQGKAVASATISNQVYLDNIRALWRVDPQLAWQIDDWGEPRAIAIEAAKSGVPTAVVQDAQARRLYMHSRYDPKGEAAKLIDGVKIEGTQAFVVHGLGLGWHVLELFERSGGDAFLLICEPDLDMLAAAMFSVDLSRVLDSEKCIILNRLEKNYLHKRLEPCSTVMMLGCQFVVHPPSDKLHTAFHHSLRETLTEYLAYTKMSLVTLVANAKVTCHNIANNLPAYLSTPPIDVLRGRFRGRPGIVISAGPSLRRNIDQLAGLRDRAVLIAVQTTLKPLLAKGIRPHFVTSLDFHEVSRSFFDGIAAEELADTHLVAEPKATWHVVDAYPGLVSLLDNGFARLLLGDALAARDGLRAGATVAHLSYYLAEYLGCDPVIFVGQDLAYTDHVFYSPGVAIHDTWRPDLNRFCSIEMKDWEHIVRRRQILRRVKDIHGNDIYADETLFTYLEQFEKDFATATSQVIDATEGGARKRGTTVMTLAEAAGRYCGSALPDECFGYRRQVKAWDPGRLSAADTEMTQRIADVTFFRDRSLECVDVLKELTRLTDKPAEFNRKLARVDELRIQVNRHERIYQLVCQMTPLAELRRISADRQMASDAGSGAERAKRQLTRDIEFVRAMAEAAQDVLNVLNESLERIRQAVERGGPPRSHA